MLRNSLNMRRFILIFCFCILFESNQAQQQASTSIPFGELHCAILDGMYMNENLDIEITKILQTTHNQWAGEYETFSAKLLLGFLSAITSEVGPVGATGAIGPVIYDLFREEDENKDALGGVIEQFEIRQEVRTSLVAKGITIKRVYLGLQILSKYPHYERLCRKFEKYHKDLNDIVFHLSSRDLHHRKFPSAIVQLMLSIAPVGTMIAHTLPVLEWETDMNCKLRDQLDDYFQLVLQHRFMKIHIEFQDSDLYKFHQVASKVLEKKLNRTVSQTNGGAIRCKKNNDGEYTIQDNLEHDKKSTSYTGDASCVEDYLTFIRYQMETQFTHAWNTLNKTCSSSRATPNGYGWLNIDIKGLNAGFRRENLSNFGVEGYYPKLSIKIYIQSLGTEAVFVKEIDNEQKKSWFSINEVYRTERISKDTFITVDIMNADTIIYHEKNTITDFVKKFILKVENRDLWVKFMYYPIWLDEYSYEEYLKTPFEGNFECPINGKTLDDLTHQDSQEVF